MKNTNLPVIACSGAGDEKISFKATKIKNISAIAAGNYFNFKERSYPLYKNFKKSKNKCQITKNQTFLNQQ